MFKPFSVFALLCLSSLAMAGDVGRDASASEIAAWNWDVRFDGQGLPVGSGNAEQGEALYEAKCAHCHGYFGEGVDRWGALAGGQGSLSDSRPTRTVGSFWPYAASLWDYIYRAMPFDAPRSLSPAEVYPLTAYVFYLNDLVDYSQVLDQDNLAGIAMPNQAGFVADARPDTANTRCMTDCVANTHWIQTDGQTIQITHGHGPDAGQGTEKQP